MTMIVGGRRRNSTISNLNNFTKGEGRVEEVEMKNFFGGGGGC